MTDKSAPQEPQGCGRGLLFYFVGAYGVSWLFWGVLFLGVVGDIPLNTLRELGLRFVASSGPTLAAFTAAVHQYGYPGVKNLLKRALRWRARPTWYGVVLLLPLALVLATLLIYFALGGGPPMSWPGFTPAAVGSVIVPALGEEFGWQGYALPRLQSRFGALWASLILGVIWSVWHLPRFFIPGTQEYKLSFVLFVLDNTVGTILFTWVYNGTGGSLLFPILLHASFNMWTDAVPVYPEYFGNIWPYTFFIVVELFVAMTVARKARSFWRISCTLPEVRLGE